MEYMAMSQPDNNSPFALDLLLQAGDSIGLAQVRVGGEGIEPAIPSPGSGNVENADDQDLQDLIVRIVNQDQVAFSALFQAMSPRVNSLALRITDSFQLAEEVAEDTFFQIWRQAPRFDPLRGTAKAWILTIARSRALDARRCIPPFDALPELDHDSVGNQDGFSRDDPPDLLSTVEQNQLLHRALETLEPLPRQLIALSFFRGLSHEEIADHAELPLGTVKSQIRRAVIHLRAILLTPSLPS
jgi:RNA polymerase sigma factor (sigma-70 family)